MPEFVRRAAGAVWRCVVYYLHLILEAATDWKNKSETGASWLTLVSPFIVRAVGAKFPRSRIVTDAIAVWLGPAVLCLVALRVLWVNYRKASSAEEPLRVAIYSGVLARNVVTLNIQVINKSLQEAVWLTFWLGMQESEEVWDQREVARGIHDSEEIVIHVGSPGPLRDPGMDKKLPREARLGPQEAIQGWITFEANPYRRALSKEPFPTTKEPFWVTEENWQRLILRVRDDATGRILDVPL